MHETPAQGLRLLVVEDEYLLALYMTDLLEEWGATVIGPAARVEDALALIDASDAMDGALLDVNLAGEAVFPVADRLLARNVPFAFASGYDPGLMPPRFADVDVFQKPIDAAALRNAVARLRRAA